jgi:beta-lactamase superfamily II metal-dependent hydrolase
MKIESLQASKGDCYFLTWNHDDKEHRIIIDCGIKGTYRFIKQKLISENKVDGIFITHIDYDHIGGLLQMVDDSNCPVDFNFPVYINTPELIIANNESGMVHYGHGSSLEDSLNKKNIDKKAIYTSLYPEDTLDIHGLKLTILSPNLEILNKLKDEWTKTSIYEKYQRDSEVDGKVSTDTTGLRDYNEIINSVEDLHVWNEDLINSSSMAFLLDKDDVRILFLGDSNPLIVEKALKDKGYSATNRLKVNFVKISHHGSKFNTSKKLLSMIDCDKYFISTNGAGPYYHPHRETIIKIAEYSRRNKEVFLSIYTNYELKKDRFITPEEEQSLNLKIEMKNEFNLH